MKPSTLLDKLWAATNRLMQSNFAILIPIARPADSLLFRGLAVGIKAAHRSAIMNGHEQWRDVVGFEGYYRVSNYGRIRRLGTRLGVAKHRAHKCRRFGTTPTGYKKIVLCVDNTITQLYVHRVVAIAFIGPPPEPDSEINHRDLNKANNHVSNLEWCTHQQNIRHAVKAGRYRGPRR